MSCVFYTYLWMVRIDEEENHEARREHHHDENKKMHKSRTNVGKYKKYLIYPIKYIKDYKST